MTTTDINTQENRQKPVKSAIASFLLQVYGATIWLLILAGGMLAVGAAFRPRVTTGDVCIALGVGALSVAFGLGSARLLNHDIRKTTPVVWF